MKKILILFTIFSIIFYVTPVNAESLNFENASSYILIDSKTGQILYGHNTDKKLYPASVTKIMTAILALEKGDLNQIMTASQAAIDDIGVDGMNIGIMPGEELRMEDLLNAMLVISANETANIIAENICPTRKDFIDLMNQKATEIGAVNTHFVTTCGAHDPDHYSTTADFAKIARYAMQIPKFREIVCKSSYQMPPTNKHSTWDTLYSTNKFLGQTSQYFTKILGIKTGYTSQAGNNLVSSAANADGEELIAVVFGVFGANAKQDVISYSKKLLEYGFSNYPLQSVVEANKVMKNVNVENASSNSTLDLVTSEELKSALPLDKSTWNIISKENIPASIKAPISKGQVLGYIEYEKDGISLGKVNLVASASISERIKSQTAPSAKTPMENTLFKKVLIGVFVLMLVFLATRIVLRKISRNLNSKSQEER